MRTIYQLLHVGVYWSECCGGQKRSSYRLRRCLGIKAPLAVRDAYDVNVELGTSKCCVGGGKEPVQAAAPGTVAVAGAVVADANRAAVVRLHGALVAPL